MEISLTFPGFCFLTLYQMPPKGVDGAGTWSSFSVEMGKQLELLGRQLKTKSKNYKEPSLRYFS